MKTTGFIGIITIGIGLCFAGCSNSGQVQKMTDLANKDSLLLEQAYVKDSTITTYLSTLSQIQDNLDKIKTREGIITLNAGEKNLNKEAIVEQVKELDQWIVANDKEMNYLQARLKKMTTKNANLTNIVMHLSQEIAIKDTEIAMMQTKLSEANENLRTITSSFNDSIVIINMQRAQVMELTAEMNTVYYVIGTIKELKNNGIVNKEGGFIGIGRTAKVNPKIDNAKYTQADLTNLKSISLNGKFKKFITTHPDNSYTITSDDKSDYVTITNRLSFWAAGKYMVVALK
jgi:hypothetical protein